MTESKIKNIVVRLVALIETNPADVRRIGYVKESQSFKIESLGLFIDFRLAGRNTSASRNGILRSGMCEYPLDAETSFGLYNALSGAIFNRSGYDELNRIDKALNSMGF